MMPDQQSDARQQSDALPVVAASENQQLKDEEAAVAIAAALLEEWSRPGGRIGTSATSSVAASLFLPPLSTLESALAVNRTMAASNNGLISSLRGDLGEHVGWKMGWKGVFPERPVLCGPLFGCGLITSVSNDKTKAKTRVSLSKYRAFAAEAEFLFVLRHALQPRLDGEKYSQEEVWTAVDRVELCIELCGARQFNSTNKFHYIADALCSSGVVRGPCIGTREVIGDPSSLIQHTVELFLGDERISSGNATNNPGDSPLASITALANELCIERKMTLDAGSIVICGHCCQAQFAGRPFPPLGGKPRPEWGMASWKEGDILRANFDELGKAEIVLAP